MKRWGQTIVQIIIIIIIITPRRCGFKEHHMHKKLVFFQPYKKLKTFLLGSICCMQTYFYLEEVSRHYNSYLQRNVTRKMTGKYLYTTIAHERKRINKIPTYLLKILTCSII